MKKESERYLESNIFEGIVSLRAIMYGIDNTISNRKIERILYLKDNINKRPKEYAWLKHAAERYGFELVLCDNADIENFAIGTSHGGIIIFCSERSFCNYNDKIASELIKKGHFFVMLDGIEDPYNFGYALRSLYSQGIDGVVMSKRNWMTAAGVVCRSSAGVSEMLPMIIDDEYEALDIFREASYKIVCADLRDSISMYDADLKLPLLLIVGGEKRGISRAILKKADINIRIDYARDFDASLSAASAATIIGAEIFRQNRSKF